MVSRVIVLVPLSSFWRKLYTGKHGAELTIDPDKVPDQGEFQFRGRLIRQ